MAFIMKKMLLVFNPNSGRGEFKKNLYEVIEIFTRADYEVAVYPTAGSGDAYAYIRERGGGFDLILCSGGDGMINEAVNAYMNMDSPPNLAYIPSGTTNDFAFSLGLPRDVIQSANAVLNGRQGMIDVGAFGDKYFAYVAAFGWFTSIPYTTDTGVKNILGRAAYLLEGIKYITNIPSIECSIDVDGEIINGNFALGIIANGTSVAGFRSITESGGAIDDGLFEVVLVRSPENFTESQEIMSTLLDPQANTPLVLHRSAKKVVFTSAQSCDWTIDGEFGGQHRHIVMENIHHAINIIVSAVTDE